MGSKVKYISGDAEEYKYDLELRRSLDKDTYEQNQKGLYKELDETQETAGKRVD